MGKLITSYLWTENTLKKKKKNRIPKFKNLLFVVMQIFTNIWLITRQRFSLLKEKTGWSGINLNTAFPIQIIFFYYTFPPLSINTLQKFFFF